IREPGRRGFKLRLRICLNSYPVQNVSLYDGYIVWNIRRSDWSHLQFPIDVSRGIVGGKFLGLVEWPNVGFVCLTPHQNGGRTFPVRLSNQTYVEGYIANRSIPYCNNEYSNAFASDYQTWTSREKQPRRDFRGGLQGFL